MKEKINNLIDFIKNNKKIFIGGLAILVLTLVFIVLLSDGSLATTDEEDSLTITCPDTASAGGEVECSIVLNSMTISTQGFNASYSVSEGMEFISFTKEGNWSEYVNDLNGFLLVDLNGVTGSNLVGTVKYKIPTTAKSNDKYKIELLDATIGDGGNISITFENVYDEIRIISDVNTLDEISLSSGSLDKEFDKDVNEHKATVNSDKVTISATKTDENSSVSGDLGEVTLHYGTNTFNILVTSESGKVNTYVLNIYRPYEFSSDNYVYNKENNYIYTGTDVDNTSILANIDVPSELTADIKDGKLNISYGEELLLKINIINFKSNKYSILDSVMYIESNLSISNFIDTITLNGVSYKVFDSNNSEVTSGNISENYKFKIYYNDTLLAEYSIKEEYLEINNLIVDDANKIIKRVVIDTTYGSLKSNINTTGSINIKDKDGNKLSDTDKVKTGDVIEINLNSSTQKYIVSVLGDINGTGDANLGDVALLYRYLKGKTELELYQIAAGDVINSGSIKVNDVSRIYRYHKGKVTSLEVE